MALECKGQFALFPQESRTAFTQLWKHLFTKGHCRNVINATVNFARFEMQNFKMREFIYRSETKRGHHFGLSLGFSLMEDHEKFLHVHYYYVKLFDLALNVSITHRILGECFLRELLFYGTILKHYEIANWHTNFSPRFYSVGRYVLYLEDLSIRGFKNVQKKEFFDLNHCALSLGTLAKFHCNAIRYEKYRRDNNMPELRTKYPRLFKESFFDRETNNSSRLWFKYPVAAIVNVLEAIPTIEQELIEKFLGFVTSWRDMFSKMQSHCFVTLLHGDLCSNNILFSYDIHTNPQECIFVDYQLITHGPPALDVLNLIYSNTTPKFRGRRYLDLLKYYYTYLCRCLNHLRVDIPVTFPDFLNICYNFRTFYLCQSICEKCVTYIPDAHGGVVAEEEIVNYHEYLIRRKVGAIRQFYVNNDTFRTTLSNDLDELRILLNDMLSGIF